MMRTNGNTLVPYNTLTVRGDGGIAELVNQPDIGRKTGHYLTLVIILRVFVNTLETKTHIWQDERSSQKCKCVCV